MEQVPQNRSEHYVDSRMGGEEMADSGFLIEEDVEVELDSGFCMEVDSELSLAGQVSVGSDEHSDTEELDWFVITEHTDSGFTCYEQSEGRGSPGRDGGSQTQEEAEMEADLRSMESGQNEAERGVEMHDETEGVKEEEMEGALNVCLWPVQSGGPVRISLEEVERYYRFSRCCHWLCGRCQMFYLSLSLSLIFFVYVSQNDSSLVTVFLSPYRIYSICFCDPFNPVLSPQHHIFHLSSSV